MSRCRPTPVQRLAVLRVHGGKCYLCEEPISFAETELDHVVPETLEQQPERLREVRRQLSLPDDFELNSYANWLPACRRCNRGKSDSVFRFTPIVQLRLDKARSKANEVEALVERASRRAGLDKALAGPVPSCAPAVAQAKAIKRRPRLSWG